jgi:hypothetical protein
MFPTKWEMTVEKEAQQQKQMLLTHNRNVNLFYRDYITYVSISTRYSPWYRQILARSVPSVCSHASHHYALPLTWQVQQGCCYTHPVHWLYTIIWCLLTIVMRWAEQCHWDNNNCSKLAHNLRSMKYQYEDDGIYVYWPKQETDRIIYFQDFSVL